MHREGLQSRIHVMGSKAFWIEEREWEQFEMVLDIIKRFCHRAVSCSLMKPPQISGSCFMTLGAPWSLSCPRELRGGVLSWQPVGFAHS